MKIKGAVLREPGMKYSIETLELDPPKENEVLVKYTHTGYCHSDLHLLKGEIPIKMPLVAGHEGAGVVEAVGPGVTTVQKGDHVGVTWMVPCGHCPNCRRGKGNICTTSFSYFLEGMLLDGTSRIRDAKGDVVRHGNFVSCFSTHSVVPERAVIPMPKEFPLEQAALMGCCVPTGWGSVFNTAAFPPGSPVAVYCLGGVGLNILRAAAMRHAYPLIAVDIEGSKRELAMEFGATHFIDSSKEDPVPAIQLLTGGEKMDDGTIMGGGAEYVFEAKGDPGAIIQAYWSTSIGGELIILGITPHDQTTDLSLMLLPLHQKTIKGNLYGAISTHDDIPRLVNMAMNHDLKLDKLITDRFKLEEINDVAEAMDKRQIKGRWVCEID
ncbi:MAG: alcohol dehydrogenase catalytic domain-containing protein [Desulfobacterales bacterium]|nr:alcohol dehydrogenase catalytic domain-containing protein [Desulfobacterales bacterium]